jgi:hypothetical protein
MPLETMIQDHDEHLEAASSNLAAVLPENDTLAIEPISIEPISSASFPAPIAALALERRLSRGRPW